MHATLVLTFFMATTPTKLAPATAHEMTAAIVAVNKSLGLESWTMHGDKPCVDRGGDGNLTKDVSAADTRRCAATAIATGFSQLGSSFVLAILMASIGPATVIALGMGPAAGWGAYSCDPGRSCPPLKIDIATKWGKRVAERQQKACSDPNTVWFPPDSRVCPATAP